MDVNGLMKKLDPTCTGPWIETFTGLKFHLLDPQPEDICIEDIAHALSNQCRYTGHVKRFYSVAEHSLHVSLLSATFPLAGLMHDASEAYIADLSRPIKQCTPVGEPYYVIENKIMKAIGEKFGFEWPPPPEVKTADNIMLLTEKDQLMTALSWSDDASTEEARKTQVLDYAETYLAGYAPPVAEKLFLQRFFQLT